jgi:hypothetical protein
MALAPSTRNLAEIGAETLRLINRVKAIGHDAEKKRPESPNVLFETEADRFELWAVNLGLFVAGHGSLDYRIREAESLESALRRVMSGLNDSLIEGK